MRLAKLLSAVALTSMTLAAPAAAQKSLLLRDSFSIGSEDGILCQVQDRSIENAAKQTMFDRAWAVICRDSARPVGTVYAFRKPEGDAASRIAAQRNETVACPAASTARVDGMDSATRQACQVSGTQLGWSIYQVEKGNMVYIADGFSAYDSATLLALRSVLNDGVVDGKIDVATTSVTDPLAFARVQAETLKPDQALAEGYRRNLGGEYAEAAAYFETLQQRLSGDKEAKINPGEFLINRALQKSNLGEFAEADRLLVEARPLTDGDPVAARLQRNFEAIHLLNQKLYNAAIQRLDVPVRSNIVSSDAATNQLEITSPISSRLNGGEGDVSLLGFVDELKLTVPERSDIIDAQALQLKGTAWRIIGEQDQARAALLDAYARAVAVRDGRVTSITRLRAQILAELSLIAEEQGNFADAEQYLRNGLEILEAQYPERRTVAAAKARLGAFLLRQNKENEAIGLYREVVDSTVGKGNAATGFENQLGPYFRLIAPRVDQGPEQAEEFFKASQVLMRPGVAETQAILARELSAGTGEAARLFRQSTTLTRDIEKLRIRFSALGKAEQTAAVKNARAELAGEIDTLERNQQRTQVQLNAYPQYRAVANRSLPLADFRQILRGGEAYARLAVVSNQLFMFYTDKDQAKAYRVPMAADELEAQIDMLRASISAFEDGQYVTYPYDIEAARSLFKVLFDPIAAELVAADHLIFEPDGALLRLPIDILVSDDASVQRYAARSGAPGGDAYDYTGVRWLGSETLISTAVSPQAFVDVRKAAPSSATREYLGMGKNTPIGKTPSPAIAASLAPENNACAWPIAQWNNPIDDDELIEARALIGGGRSQVITGADFTDERIKSLPGLSDYRILHFATHGLVTSPNNACPARPALLTSFGDGSSDGLLSFDEVFELDIDADVVILSACDTAAAASVQATREAGITSGGGSALDGLVRSFIGAGGRSVLASHWPAPDDFNATRRLIDGLFRNGRNTSFVAALRQSQRALMNDPDTSHPYYWAGFAIIGDGQRELVSSDQQITAAIASGAAPQ